MLIAIGLGALVAATTARPVAAPFASFAQTAAAVAQDPQEPPEKKVKGGDKEKKPKQAKSDKKARKNKVAKDEEPAPDEPIDPQVDVPGRGVTLAWKQHPCSASTSRRSCRRTATRRTDR
jgi:hypothetical protein